MELFSELFGFVQELFPLQSIQRDCSQTLIVVALIVVILFVFGTVLETFLFSHILDNIWTQCSPICPLTVEHKMGPYIDREGSTTRV